MTDLDTLQAETEAALAAATDLRALDAIRVGVLGKSGRLTAMLKELGRATPDERRERGAALNRLRDSITGSIEARRANLDAAALDARLAAERIDVTLPPPPEQPGLIHLISRTMEEMAAIFGAMGFSVGEGPEIETAWSNFAALNIPAHHPARTEMDTFYVPGTNDGQPRVLRTHTSNVQIISMLGGEPPMRVIAPGRVYRADHDGIDPRVWQGFAFGMGVERVAMLKYGIADLRPFYECDLRWLRHYGFNPLAPVALHEGVAS
jgi:phenylalanyl-tRNA synthetase alpha chain